ncbi:hypothetical protein BC829DRAFT_381244 [Chytridium lagenaria]|nr:hypothetical protein BC829DRAFT_381244 [Chytridium lagenaria]
MATRISGTNSPRPYGSLQNLSSGAGVGGTTQQDQLAPRSGSEISVKTGGSGNLSSAAKKLRGIALEWAVGVLGTQGITVKFEDDGTFFNELRNGVIPCQIMNILAPGTARISDVKSTFSQLENLASFTAALILYGMERKTVLKPLDFVNGTQKGDEMMLKNLIQLSLLSVEKGFKHPTFNPTLAKEALELFSNPHQSPQKSQAPPSPSTPLTTRSTVSFNELKCSTRGCRIMKNMQDKIDKNEKSGKTTQQAMDKLLDTLDLVFRKLVDIDTSQKEISDRITSIGMQVNRRSRPISMTESEVDDMDYDGHSARANAVKRGMSSDSLLNGGLGEDTLRRTVTSSERAARTADLHTSVNVISAASSSPSLLGTLPTTPISPKLFAKLPTEVMNAGLPKNDMMRLSVVYELIETEADYVKDLGILVNYHKVEVRNTKLVSEQDITTLFSNVEQLIVANNLQSRPEFKEHVQRWMNSPEGRGLSVESFLIKPVQRICKYPLLLRELLKYKIEAVVALVNEATNALDKKERLSALQSKIESATPLNLADKKLLKDGLVQRYPAENLRNVSSFSARLPAKFRYQFESMTSTADICPRAGLKYFFQIQISGEKRELYTLSFASEDEKNKWFDAFMNAIKQSELDGRRVDRSSSGTDSLSSLKRISDTFDSTSSLKGKSSIKKTVSGISGTMFSKQGKKVQTPRRRGISAETFESQSTLETEEDNTYVEPELVDIAGAIWKRAISAMGHTYYYNPTTRESIWRLPDNAIILDPVTGPDYDFEPETLENHPDWRYVDKGDGNPYYFHAITMEVSWYPPGFEQAQAA